MASLNKVMLEHMYLVERMSIPDIAERLGINRSKARNAMLSVGIELRSRADGIRNASHKLGKHRIGVRREFSPTWRANIRAARIRHAEHTACGISNKTGGYVEVTRGPNKGRGFHRVVMEKHLGRRLGSDEVVHHKDEDKHNNHISNLEVMTRSEHAKLHRQLEKEKKNGIR